MQDSPAPIELRLRRASRVLEVRYTEDEFYRLPFEYLRVHSPSAEVQGHGPGQETLVLGKQKRRRHRGRTGRRLCHPTGVR